MSNDLDVDYHLAEMMKKNVEKEFSFRMTSKELVLISKALRGIYSEEDVVKMKELSERMLKATGL